MASVEPPWKRLRSTAKPPTPPQPPPGRPPKVTIKPVVDLVEETVMWPEEGIPEITLDACCKHYRDLTKSTEKVNLTLSRRGATEVLGQATAESPAEPPSRDESDAKDPDAVPTILCTLRRDRDPRSVITSETGDLVVAVDPQYSGSYGHLREKRANSTTTLSGEGQPQQADSVKASVSESDSGRDAVTPMERSEGDQRSVRSPSPVRSPSQVASSPPWVRAAAAAAASLAWFGKGKGMHPPPFMAPAFARMAAMNRMRAAQGYTDQRGEGPRPEQMSEGVEYNGQRQANFAQTAVPMDQSACGMPGQPVPGLQYQPPRPAAQGGTEGFMPGPYQGGPYQTGGMPPAEPFPNHPQHIPGLPPQQPPMPPWAGRGQYGPSGFSFTMRTAEASKASSPNAYPHVQEPSAPSYEAYGGNDSWQDGCESEGASERQAFYGYRPTADDYNSGYSWSQKTESPRTEERKRESESTSSGDRRPSRTADIGPEEAMRALIYHGVMYTVRCLRKAGTWVGIKMCNKIERQLVAKRQTSIRGGEPTSRLALYFVDGALQRTRRIHDWLAVQNI
ncbi:hypothetical protein FOL47_005394 [Perkinsus chesapeaki]|uniref:Uncharacterized protein n=1 Tax=Perkinsus chesapeaki TaxID=330153 RepID=A0A7J6N2P0_PERCH|nr:hypothetical protein FOL47_005394 [Perkinsus chesapeaki]